MEQQPGPVNWAPSNPRPAPGMVTLWSLEAIAHGADVVSFFRWRQAQFAQEQMHAGLLRPDRSRSDAWAEVETVVGVIKALENEPLFDQTLLDWLAGRSTTWVDLRDPFREDFARSSLDADTYLEPFYNGHHTPKGNFFFAWGIKDRVVDWMDPKPAPYSGRGAEG